MKEEDLKYREYLEELCLLSEEEIDLIVELQALIKEAEALLKNNWEET